MSWLPYLRNTDHFDVVVTTNMFGDLLSDEATEISGSIGLAASLNVGAEHAVAQAQHGSAPALAGQDMADSASLIGSTAMLLQWMSGKFADERMISAAADIQRAIEAAVKNPPTRTGDLGGNLGTKSFTRAVIEHL